MDKETPGLDAAGIARICREAADAGIGVHLNLIAGFPGERPDELEASVAFVEQQLAALPKSTFSLTPFMLFNEAPIAARPDRPADIRTDQRRHAVHAHVRWLERLGGRPAGIFSSLPRLERRLRAAAGWGGDRASRRACELISETGHALIFKSARIRGPESPRWRAA